MGFGSRCYLFFVDIHVQIVLLLKHLNYLPLNNTLIYNESLPMEYSGFSHYLNGLFRIDLQSVLLRQSAQLYEQLNEALAINKSLMMSSVAKQNCGSSASTSSTNPVASHASRDIYMPESSSNSSKQNAIKINKKSPRQEISPQRPVRTQRNDTKNIPKNFGSAICTFIKKNPAKVKRLLAKKNISLPSFLRFTKKMKSQIQSIHDLREAWSPSGPDPENELKTCFRILSFQFIRENSLEHIFISRIKNVPSHIKYRSKLLEALKNPSALTNLKDY